MITAHIFDSIPMVRVDRAAFEHNQNCEHELSMTLAAQACCTAPATLRFGGFPQSTDQDA